MPPIKMVYICPSNTQIVQFIKVKSTSCKGLKGKIYIRPAVTTFLYTWIFGHRTLPWVNLEVWWCSNSRGSMPGRMWHWLCRPEACTRITRFSCFIRRKKKHAKLGKSFSQSKSQLLEDPKRSLLRIPQRYCFWQATILSFLLAWQLWSLQRLEVDFGNGVPGFRMGWKGLNSLVSQ